MASEILAAWPGMEAAPPALELTTGIAMKSQCQALKNKQMKSRHGSPVWYAGNKSFLKSFFW